jgi:hypothetical protein
MTKHKLGETVSLVEITHWLNADDPKAKPAQRLVESVLMPTLRITLEEFGGTEAYFVGTDPMMLYVVQPLPACNDDLEDRVSQMILDAAFESEIDFDAQTLPEFMLANIDHDRVLYRVRVIKTVVVKEGRDQ